MASRTMSVNRDLGEAEHPPGITHTPARFALSIFSSAFAILRPFAPQLFPIVFCCLIIPFCLLLSGIAGLLVWRNVAVGWESPIHLQFGDGTPPYALTALPKLAGQQPYDISLRLILPATESNYALGNFMAKLTISTSSNKTLISARRPAIAYPPHTSFFRRKPTVLTLDVPMLSSYVPGSSKLLAFVELGRQDGWKSLGNGEGREIRVIIASIRGLVVHRGIRGLVLRFPLLFALFSGTAFFAITLTILGMCILPTMLPRPEGVLDHPVNQPSQPHSPLTSGSDIDNEQPPVRRRRSRPSRSTSRKTDNIGLTPHMNTSPDPLRRRRSRTLEGLSDSDS